MLRDILFGTLAGAAGTVALNIATYADMAIRGRPSSQTPAKVAEKIAAGAGVDLAGQAGASAQGQAPSSSPASGTGTSRTARRTTP